MGKSSSPSRTTQTTEPWEPVRSYLEGSIHSDKPGVFPSAATLFKQERPLFAGFDRVQNVGQSRNVRYADEMLPGLLGQYQQSAVGALNAPDVNNNPYLEQAMQAATRPFEQQLSLGTLPNIGRSFTGAGQYGSSRQGVAEGVARGLTNQAVLDTRGRMGSDAYNRGLDHQARALALFPTVAQAGTMPGDILQQVGAQRQGMAQRRLDEPYERLNRYASIIQPGAGIGGSVTGPGPQGPSGLSQGLGNAASMAAVLSFLFPPAAPAAGASDVRLKTNIRQIGEVGDFTIYQWDWKSGGSSAGVIAQEVEHTGAVFEVGGVKMVDYAKLARMV